MSVRSDRARVPSARTDAEAVDAVLRIGVLGQLVATREGATLELGGPRQRAVLALLVLARGDVLPADRLIWARLQAVRAAVDPTHTFVANHAGPPGVVTLPAQR